MLVGVITGTGMDQLPGLQEATADRLSTPFGEVAVTRGRLAGTEVVHCSRHGPGHRRLSNHVPHRAHALALRELAPGAVIGVSACGSLDSGLSPGSLVVFDDLYFPGNRLADGSLATLHTASGRPERGHWIFERPYAAGVRTALLQAGEALDAPVRDGGTYGHVDGPRYNTRTEIDALARLGVVAVSQTGGPETVLLGEAELAYALVGYVTDHATGVSRAPTPEEAVRRHVAAKEEVVAELLAGAVRRLAGADPQPPGFVYRYE